MTDPNLLRGALDYAAMGWRVLPLHDVASVACSCGNPDCASPGKHPRNAHGLKDAITDPKVIHGWWRSWPTANVAIATGPESGVWMLGPDGERGIADLDSLESECGPLPGTVMAQSGSGGVHLLFRWPSDGLSITNRQNHRGLKIDVRGQGGYFVASPSRNAKGVYAWLKGRAPGQIELAEAPKWLLEWVREAGKARTPTPPPPSPRQASTSQHRPDSLSRASAWLANCPEAVSGQGGHNATMWAARGLVRGFLLTEEQSLDLLLREYNPRCRPSWTEGELQHKIEEAATKPFDKPDGWLLNADRPGWTPPVRRPLRVHFPPVNEGPPPAINSARLVRDHHLTDTGNADRLAIRHGQDLHHCFPWAKWLAWDGQRWVLDDSGEVMRRAQATVDEMWRWTVQEMKDILRGESA